MITGNAFSAAMSVALFTASTDLPTFGAFPPACEVEKKTGSIASKSRSSRMRCTSTEPTIPRQPTMPTLSIPIVYRAATTASPISWVPTLRAPAVWMSAVRTPAFNTLATAASMRPAACASPSE